MPDENCTVLLALNLPHFDGPDAVVSIVKVHVAEGAAVRPGSPLLDVRVQLSEGIAWDCPPISHYRILASEPAWVRRVDAALAVDLAAGARVMLLSSEIGEPIEGTAARKLRTSQVSVLADPEWWVEG